jgi:hypothetical protein
MPRPDLTTRWSLATGGLVAAVLLWPALVQGGALAFVDLLALPRTGPPRTFWWLGPDLVRRFPGFVPYGLLGGVIGGVAASRLMLAATIVTIVAGTGRLAVALRPGAWKGWRAPLPGWGGAVVACSPFVTTRLSTGHLTTLWAVAAAPLVIAAAVSGRPIGRSRLVAGIAWAGVVAGVYTLLVTVLTLMARRITGALPADDDVLPLTFGRRVRDELLGWTVRNLLWILPGVYLSAHGFSSLVDARWFRPRVSSGWDVVGFTVGRGYWDPIAEAVPGHRLLIAVVALVLVGLAARGASVLAAPARTVVLLCVVVGYGVPFLASQPVVGDAVLALTRTPLGVALREPHRLIGLGLVPLVACSVVGMGELSVGAWRPRPVAGLLAVAASAALAAFVVSSIGAVHDRLDPMPVPASWSAAAELVDDEGGTVLTLPWAEYVDLRIDHRRKVFNPLPDLFGWKTVSSADPQLGPPVNESADARAAAGTAAASELLAGRPAVEQLRALRVRWVAVLHADGLTGLPDTSRAGLEPVIESDTLDLYRVDLDPVPTSFDGPFGRITADRPVDEPWLWGWFDGSGILGRTDAGVVDVTGHQGRTAIFLPAVVGLALAVLSLRILLNKPDMKASQRHDDRQYSAEIGVETPLDQGE